MNRDQIHMILSAVSQSFRPRQILSDHNQFIWKPNKAQAETRERLIKNNMQNKHWMNLSCQTCSVSFKRSGGDDDGLCVFCEDLLTFMTHKRKRIGTRNVTPLSLNIMFNSCTVFTSSSIIRFTSVPVSE